MKLVVAAVLSWCYVHVPRSATGNAALVIGNCITFPESTLCVLDLVVIIDLLLQACFFLFIANPCSCKRIHLHMYSCWDVQWNA